MFEFFFIQGEMSCRDKIDWKVNLAAVDDVNNDNDNDDIDIDDDGGDADDDDADERLTVLSVESCFGGGRIEEDKRSPSEIFHLDLF